PRSEISPRLTAQLTSESNRGIRSHDKVNGAYFLVHDSSTNLLGTRTSWRHPWDPTLGVTLTRMSAMANATPIVTTVTKTTNKEKASDAAPGVNVVDFCEEYYEDILSIIMDKARRDKRKEGTKTKYRYQSRDRDRFRRVKIRRESESPSSRGSESSTSNKGHWKSRSKRHELVHEDDLAVP
ncbi:hypothetical protein Tco_0998713, partial [Tanacetum coccineum]